MALAMQTHARLEFVTTAGLPTPDERRRLTRGTAGAAPQFLSRAESAAGTRSSAEQGNREMLKIEKDCDGSVTRLRLSGRIESDLVASIRSAMTDCCAHKILDLREVTLVDLGVVRFLISCEDEGIELAQSPLYVREWILRERAAGA
jgi:hypothetical protein